ncbi:pneumococcal-type histidine triad protein [Streptococcus fryi]
MNKKKSIALASVSLLCSLALLGCQSTLNKGNENTKKTDPKVSQPTDKKDNHDKQEMVYVVAALSEDGYTLIEGDHEHFETGTVPYDAYFLEDTLNKDKDYKLDMSDVLYQVKTGYIIKVNDKVYYHPKEKGLGIVTLKEARQLTKNNPHEEHDDHSDENKKGKGVAGIDHPTSDGFLFTDEKQISGKTDQGLIIEHDGHQHFVFYSDLKGSKWEYLIPTTVTDSPKPMTSHASSSQTHDNYQFNPADIVSEDALGYTVRHGDHFHYILKNKVSAAVHNLTAPSVTGTSQPNITLVTKPENTIPSTKGIAGIDYPTSDGFLFDGSGVIGTNTIGLLVNHGGHIHVLPKEAIASSRWAFLLNTETAKPSTSTPSTHSSKPTETPEETPTIPNSKMPSPSSELPEVMKKRAILAKALNIDPNRLMLIDTPQGKAFLYPHEDHQHAILLTDIDDNRIFETPEEIARKVEYISKVYGVPKEAIKVSDTTFAFNDPSHEFDPTHVHPYIIFRHMLVIPPVTGDPETDFEAELLAVSKRTGISPNKLIIRDGKFVIPHDEHDHLLNIQAVDGIEPYLANKLPNITGPYQQGDFDKNAVESESLRLKTLAAERFGEDSKEYRRIVRTLNAFNQDLNELVTNSTKGYLAMLGQFEKQYLLNEETDQADSALTERYNKVLEMIRDYDFQKLPVTSQDMIDRLNKASQEKDLQAMANLQHILEQMTTFKSRAQITSMEYIDHLLSHVEKTYVPEQLQEELAQLLLETFTTNLGSGKRSLLDLSLPLIELKIALQEAKEANQTYPISQSEAYQGLKDSQDFINSFVEEVRGLFTGDMTFPDKVTVTDSSRTNQTTEAYHKVIDLLKGMNVSKTGLSQEEWMTMINEASLSNEPYALANIEHTLLELKKFQDRPGITKMEYLNHLIQEWDNPYLTPQTRDVLAQTINRTYRSVIRREAIDNPDLLAKELIQMSLQTAKDRQANKTYPVEDLSAYKEFVDNRPIIDNFLGEVRDFLSKDFNLPDHLKVSETDAAATTLSMTETDADNKEGSEISTSDKIADNTTSNSEPSEEETNSSNNEVNTENTADRSNEDKVDESVESEANSVADSSVAPE